MRVLRSTFRRTLNRTRPRNETRTSIKSPTADHICQPPTELTAHCESEEHMNWDDEGQWLEESGEHVGEDV